MADENITRDYAFKKHKVTRIDKKTGRKIDTGHVKVDAVTLPSRNFIESKTVKKADVEKTISEYRKKNTFRENVTVTFHKNRVEVFDFSDNPTPSGNHSLYQVHISYKTPQRIYTHMDNAQQPQYKTDTELYARSNFLAEDKKDDAFKNLFDLLSARERGTSSLSVGKKILNRDAKAGKFRFFRHGFVNFYNR